MLLPGATRLTLFGACPWLSYSAPLALVPDFHISRLWRWCLTFIFRAVGGGARLSYSAPLALAPDFHIPRLWRWHLAFHIPRLWRWHCLFIFRRSHSSYRHKRNL